MKRRKIKKCSLEEYSSFFEKDNVIVDVFCLFFLYYFFKILSNLRTNYEQLSLDFGEKLRTIEPHLQKHGSYLKKKECSCET